MKNVVKYEDSCAEEIVPDRPTQLFKQAISAYFISPPARRLFFQKTSRFGGFYTPLRELDSAIQGKSDRFEFSTIKTSELALFNSLLPI